MSEAGWHVRDGVAYGRGMGIVCSGPEADWMLWAGYGDLDALGHRAAAGILGSRRRHTFQVLADDVDFYRTVWI